MTGQAFCYFFFSNFALQNSTTSLGTFLSALFGHILPIVTGCNMSSKNQVQTGVYVNGRKLKIQDVIDFLK